MKQLLQGYAVPVLKRSAVKKICLSSIAATLALSMNAYSHDNAHNLTTQKADLILRRHDCWAQRLAWSSD